LTVAVDPKAEQDPSFVTALARGLAVIRAFDSGPDAMTMADIARATDLPRASVRRALFTLEALGYVASDGRSYRLTPQVLALGYAYLAGTPLPQIVQPAIEAISDRFHEYCSVAVLDGAEIISIARSRTKRIMSVGLAVGSRLPAHCTSLGRVLLAALPREKRREILEANPPQALTPRTITDLETLMAALDAVAQQGYALIDQELEIGLRTMGVPVRNVLGEVVAALSVTAQTTRVSVEAFHGEVLPILREAAASIQPQLVV
jgi:IclR family pca regulon transcriptional regulator